MFLGDLLKEGSHSQLLFEKLLENKARNSKTWQSLDKILKPSIRYRIIWSKHVPNVKEHIRLY